MILAFMQFPPDPQSYGGAQRAWYIAEALAEIGPVHFVLLHQTRDSRFDGYETARLRQIAESVTIISVPEWDSAVHTIKHKKLAGVMDWLRMGSTDAPRLSKAALRNIATQLPVTQVDTLFAVRIPMATIAQDLVAHELVTAEHLIADYDDIVSRFRHGEQLNAPKSQNALVRFGAQRQLGSLRSAEEQIAKEWDAISLCSDDDVQRMREVVNTGKQVRKVQNVVDRPFLAPTPSAVGRLLFVGNLSFRPNINGLERFLGEAWPTILQERPDTQLRIIGLNPSAELAKRIEASGASLYANVPSVEPYYRDTDVVLAPIFFGSGTRIKILEAMAFGRPVVSTTLGAEGLELKHGTDVLIADEMPDFALLVLDLLRDADRRHGMARVARTVQQSLYGPPAMRRAIKSMVGQARHYAEVA